MEFEILPWSSVEQTLRADSNMHIEQEALHNTHSHTFHEIQAALPSQEIHRPKSQPWILFDPFCDLVLQSQAITDVHTILLPKRFLDVVLEVSQSGILLQRLSSSSLEDLEDAFPELTTAGVCISDLFDSAKKYFARLSTCSMKDSVFQPSNASKEVQLCSEPLTKSDQIWKRIATSARAVQGIKDLRAAGIDMRLYLLPWDEHITPQQEYRVFCAPNGGRVTAVSQYRWHEPWAHFSEDVSRMKNKALSVLHRILEIRKLLGEDTAAPLGTLGLKTTGFTFDVADLGDRIVLLEINDFGAMTGCGSCLFHWIRDASILYGVDTGEERPKPVVFRVLGNI